MELGLPWPSRALISQAGVPRPVGERADVVSEGGFSKWGAQWGHLELLCAAIEG